jgi:hypothetical protein
MSSYVSSYKILSFQISLYAYPWFRSKVVTEPNKSKCEFRFYRCWSSRSLITDSYLPHVILGLSVSGFSEHQIKGVFKRQLQGKWKTKPAGIRI